MIPRVVLRRWLPLAVGSSPLRRVAVQQGRTFVPAPKGYQGPLMERRGDRELPEVPRSKLVRTLPLFIAIIAVASIAIFNYQKMTSSVVSSTLYSLRTSDRARTILGDEIYFKDAIPWISGEMNQLQGRIDISFKVKGTKTEATMHFKSIRPSPKGVFETLEWSLETSDGKRIDLLEDDDDFTPVILTDEDIKELKEESSVRGFRKSSFK